MSIAYGYDRCLQSIRCLYEDRAYLTVAADSIGSHRSRWYRCASWTGGRRVLHPSHECSLQGGQLHRQLQICQHGQSASLPCPALPLSVLPCCVLLHTALPCPVMPYNCCNKHAMDITCEMIVQGSSESHASLQGSASDAVPFWSLAGSLIDSVYHTCSTCLQRTCCAIHSLPAALSCSAAFLRTSHYRHCMWIACCCDRNFSMAWHSIVLYSAQLGSHPFQFLMVPCSIPCV